jgi:hypothetical protein
MSFSRSLRGLGIVPGSARDRAVGATVRAIARAEALPGPLDTSAEFKPGRALVRRVPRENLWIWYRVDEMYLHLLAVRAEPPVPADD